MAKQPELVSGSDGKIRVDASFPSGRYTFSLRSEAAGLLSNLGYDAGDTLPWYLFESLAIVGEAWLPNTSGSFTDDLAVPDSLTTMDDAEAAAVAAHLEGRRVSAKDRDRLAAVVASSALGKHLSVDDFDAKEEWVV